MTLLAFIGLVWLREQILHGGGPEWLEMEANAIQHGPNQQQPQNNIMEEDAGLVLEGTIDVVKCLNNKWAVRLLSDSLKIWYFDSRG